MNISWKSCIRIILSVMLVYFFISYFHKIAGWVSLFFSAASPIVIGCIIAYIVNIPMSFYERHVFVKTKKSFCCKIRRPLCVLMAYLTIILIFILVVSLILPQLISCVKLVIAKLPGVLEGITENLKDFRILPEDAVGFLEEIDWKSRIDSVIKVVTKGAGNVFDVIVSAVVSVFSGVATAIVSIIFSIYLLASKDSIRNQFLKLFKRYISPKFISKINYVLRVFNQSFHKYIVAQCTEAVILGVLCSLGMLIFRMPYAAMIGALIAFTALVPIVGAFIGAGVGAFMILTVSPFKALMFIIFIIVLQQIEENLIYPKVVGSSVNLPGIWVLAAITIGGGLMGVVGMLIAVPIASAVYRIIGDDVNGYGTHGGKKVNEV